MAGVEERKNYELIRLTSLGDPPAFSILLRSLLSSFNALAFDCPDLHLLEPHLKGPGNRDGASVLQTIFSHADPDHFDISSGLEWRQPIWVHEISWMLSQYLFANVGKSPDSDTKPPEYKNVTHYQSEVSFKIPGVGTITPYPISHGTFLHGFWVETEKGQTMLVVPDSSMGLATEQTIAKLRDLKGNQQLDLFIGDFKNFGSNQLLNGETQLERLETLLQISRGGIFDGKGKRVSFFANPQPVFAYIKPGHIMQLENWWRAGIFREPTYINARLHDLLGPNQLGKDPNSVWAQIHACTKPITSEAVGMLAGQSALYITDFRRDQARYTLAHLLFDCARGPDLVHSTEKEKVVVTGGMSGHDPRAAMMMIEELQPTVVAISHNGNGYNGNGIANTTKAILNNFRSVEEVVMPKKGSRYAF